MTECRFTYFVFGLTLRSNGPIPELSLTTRADAVADVHVHLNLSPLGTRILPSDPETLTYTSPYQDESGNSMLRIWSIAGGKFCRLDYADGTQFWLDRDGTEVWATWRENSTIEDTATYLLGPVLGRLLRLRGVTCLHASAVAFGEQAVAIVGPAGAGKSTTAAALALRGHAILSDDVVALAERDRSFYVHSAYPYLCLWPESVRSSTVRPTLCRNSALITTNAACRSEIRNCGSRNVPCNSLRSMSWASAAAILLLQSKTFLRSKRFFRCLANTFGMNVVDGSMRAKEFEMLGRLRPGCAYPSDLAARRPQPPARAVPTNLR